MASIPTKRHRLTEPQRELLSLICLRDGRGITVAPSHSPARRLVSLGLAELRTQRLGHPQLVPTEAGKREDKRDA